MISFAALLAVSLVRRVPKTNFRMELDSGMCLVPCGASKPSSNASCLVTQAHQSKFSVKSTVSYAPGTPLNELLA